jgi:phosphatidate cytidylyltransferase
VGLALVPLLPLVLFIAPNWVLTAGVSVISALSVWEVLAGTGCIHKKRLAVYASAFAVCVPLWVYGFSWVKNADWIPLTLIAGFFMLLFIEAVLDHENLRFTHIGAIFTAAVILPYFFSALIRIEALPNGIYYIIMPFIAAILNDVCAYFAGVKLGKRKLTPISPKKTVEGAIGGAAGALIGMAGYGIVLQFVFSISPSYPLLLLYGLLGASAGMLGDLSMSLVKREFKIKDFGTLLPGHGGVLDRFDSLLFAAPVLEILMRLLPAIS